MKFVLLAGLMVASVSHAAVFGQDDRVEAIRVPQFMQQTRATAVWTSNLYIAPSADGNGLTLDLPLLSSGDGANVCSDEKFAAQPISPVACTGFLVAPDLLLTAGHCSLLEGEIHDVSNAYCTDFKWVFGFATDSSGSLPDLKSYPSRNVVGCKKIIYAIQNPIWDPVKKIYSSFRSDFALIELDRKVTDHPVIALSKQAVSLGDKLTLIGYPAGLPAKAVSGQVTENADSNYFHTGFTVFGGDSGGPVLNSHGLAVGILVRQFPDADYVLDNAKGCQRSNVCDAQGRNCLSGETVDIPGAQVQRIDPKIFDLISAHNSGVSQ